MSDEAVILGGVLLTLAVLVLFFQVALLSSRVDRVESNLTDVKFKVERNTERINELSGNLKELESNLLLVKKSLEESRKKTSLLWKEVLRAEKEVLNLKSARDLPVPPLESQYTTIIIASGDTLKEMSDAFQLGEYGIDLIVALNGLKDPNTIYVGEKIKIPASLKEKTSVPFNVEISKGMVEKGFDESGWVIFKLPAGTRVLSCMPGRVEEVREGYVRIYHGNSVESSYKWKGEIWVKKGQWVRSGEPIGVVKGDSLMFAVMVDGEPKDPLRVIFSYVGKFSASFYTEWEDGVLPQQATFKVTRSGKLVEKWWTVAADPKLLPLGSIIYIPEFARYPGGGIFEVQDTGAVVKDNRVDIYVGDLPLALKMARREVKVYVLRGD